MIGRVAGRSVTIARPTASCPSWIGPPGPVTRRGCRHLCGPARLASSSLALSALPCLRPPIWKREPGGESLDRRPMIFLAARRADRAFRSSRCLPLGPRAPLVQPRLSGRDPARLVVSAQIAATSRARRWRSAMPTTCSSTDAGHHPRRAARLCDVYAPELFRRSGPDRRQLWDGGMSFHGGVIGTSASAILYWRWRNKLNWLRVHDYVASACRSDCSLAGSPIS